MTTRTVRGGSTKGGPLCLPLVLFSLLLLAMTPATVRAEDVCPGDASVLFSDGAVDSSSRRRQRHLTEVSTADDFVTIVRQTTTQVEFTVTSGSIVLPDAGGPFVSDHIFVEYETDVYKSSTCPLYDDLSTGDTSPVMTAYCHETATKGSIALVKVFVRQTSINPGQEVFGGALIPNCCNDPYSASVDGYLTIEYVFEVPCEATCDEPDTYEPPAEECTGGTASPLSRDLVFGTQRNGPHIGSGHSWAWPPTGDNGCAWFANVDNDGTGAYAYPCYASSQMKDRVLEFDSPYMNFRFAFDAGMTATIALPDGSASKSFFPSGDALGETPCASPNDFSWNNYPIRLVKSGRYHHHWYVDGVSCDVSTRLEIKVTPDWYVETFPRCGNKTGTPSSSSSSSTTNATTTMLKSDPILDFPFLSRCSLVRFFLSFFLSHSLAAAATSVELHLVSDTAGGNARWFDNDTLGDVSMVDQPGYSSISYCVECESEITGDPDAELSGCSIVSPTDMPSDCCPLNLAADGDGVQLCGTGWTYDVCPGTSLMTTRMTSEVSLSTSPSYPVTADGHSFQVDIPRGVGNQMVNDELIAIIQNDSVRDKKVKINFHIVFPRRSTGINGVLLDPDDLSPTGIHVQMSKNWHVDRNPALYDDYWWTGVAHFRVPPGETRLKLVVAYQYYEGIHAASHSQLCLLGWGTNGLWEE